MIFLKQKNDIAPIQENYLMRMTMIMPYCHTSHFSQNVNYAFQG